MRRATPLTIAQNYKDAKFTLCNTLSKHDVPHNKATFSADGWVLEIGGTLKRDHEVAVM